MEMRWLLLRQEFVEEMPPQLQQKVHYGNIYLEKYGSCSDPVSPVSHALLSIYTNLIF